MRCYHQLSRTTEQRCRRHRQTVGPTPLLRWPVNEKCTPARTFFRLRFPPVTVYIRILGAAKWPTPTESHPTALGSWFHGQSERWRDSRRIQQFLEYLV